MRVDDGRTAVVAVTRLGPLLGATRSALWNAAFSKVPSHLGGVLLDAVGDGGRRRLAARKRRVTTGQR